MSETQSPMPNLDKPEFYEIRIEGHLEDRWTSWFEGLTLTLEDGGNTLLAGMVTDQAALQGLLKKVRDLGMPLISVNRIKPDQKGAPEVEH